MHSSPLSVPQHRWTVLYPWLLFAPDGMIQWALLNTPGSEHDSTFSIGLHNKLMAELDAYCVAWLQALEDHLGSHHCPVAKAGQKPDDDNTPGGGGA